jgi:5'-nucleotidase/UDP-sugar diphosphatase
MAHRVLFLARRAGLFALAWVMVACATQTRTVVLFHTSDVHGGIEPHAARWHVANPSRMIGGQATLAALIAKEPRPKLLVDSGDVFQGTPIGNLTKGDAVIEGMNALGYAAMAIGNHEYDYGEPNLERLAALAKFPMLATNIRRRETGDRPEYAKPSTMVEVGGVRVGLVGVATRSTSTSTLPQNVAHLLFEDEVDAVKREAQRLRDNGADVVVALSHCGLAPSQARKRVDAKALTLTAADETYAGDLAIARGAPVDLVLGGHLHTGISGTWKDPVSGVVIVQSYEGLEAVSRVHITVDGDGKPEIESELLDLWTDTYGADPAIAALVKGFAAKIGTELDKPVCELTGDLRRVDGGLDSPLGNVVADAMLRAVDGADIAIQNSFGIRADLYAGKVVVRDIYRVLPFDNTLTVVEVSGEVVEKIVMESLRDGRARLQFGGLTANITLGDSGEVASVSVGVGGRSLDKSRTYRVVTNNYLTSGGGGGERLSNIPVVDTGRSLRDVLAADLMARTPVAVPSVGRLLVITPL